MAGSAQAAITAPGQAQMFVHTHTPATYTSASTVSPATYTITS